MVNLNQSDFEIKKLHVELPEITLDSKGKIIYSEKIHISLEIMIANIGLGQTIMDCVLKHKGIPSYLIINGFMGGSFLDEAKYATYINSYSKSIKKLYYKKQGTFILPKANLSYLLYIYIHMMYKAH